MEQEKTIKAYKGFNKDLSCRDQQYEVGKTYDMGGKALLCKRGYHSCENPLDVIKYYGDVLENRYCEVEASGDICRSEDSKLCSTKLKVNAEIGFAGLFKAGIEWIKEQTNPKRIIEEVKDDSSSTNDNGGDSAKIGSSGNSAQIGSSGNYAQIGSSGDSAKIGSSGNSAKIGSSGDYAQIDSTGEDSVICCAGNNSIVKAKAGSWITLAEWLYSEEKKRWIPKCVKTEYVDGERIKADTWYKLVDREFKEV
jgi:hypothetical protein